MSNGQILPYDEAVEVMQNNPDVTLKYNTVEQSQTVVYKDKFLNSTFFRAFIGWSAVDVGKDIEEGIPGVTGRIGQDQSLPPLFGWNMTHFKLVYRNSGLRILKYYDGATIYGTVATPNGEPVVNANVTVLDEYKIPHATATTDSYGKYSILVPAGNLTLTVSLGTPEAEWEIIRKTANNILATRENLIVSEKER